RHVTMLAAARAVHPEDVLYYAVAGLVALVVHEFAHAVAAGRLGDPTPKAMGRQTLKPKPHVDTFGTLVLPAILLLIIFFTGPNVMFAYAKPMPLNPWSSRRATRDTVLVQAAGPLANLILAFGFGVAYSEVCTTTLVGPLLAACVVTNALFAAIHIIPIPPLDAARAIAPFLPPRPREVMLNLEQYAPLFMLLVFFLLGGFFFSIVGNIQSGILSLIPLGNC
ncbi:MAG TPA: site-2 protease family protein, partial [Actinomycetota bacterium]|nr:site-2 protease family protein [Actinomycetota bacterium]